MSDKLSGFEPAFIEQQRERLERMLQDQSATLRGEETDESELHAPSAEAHEAEDDAQKLTLLEIDGTLVARSAAHVPLIRRALQKIEEGTYGFSDASHERIPRERLEAMPEAVYTLAEQAARDADDRRQ